MLIKEKSTMTESEKISVRNTNIQFLEQLCIFPVGAIIPYGGGVSPSGWLVCNGDSVSKSSYPDLFLKIGYAYGGSGNNFNLPDLREAVPIGYKSGSDLTGTLGETIGENEHEISVDELPEITPTISNAFTGSAGIGGSKNTIPGFPENGNGQYSISCDTIGEGQPMQIVSKSVVTNFIIKASSSLSNLEEVTGKGLSTNDYTDTDKAKVDSALQAEDIDQTYNPESENAQSGTAVAEAVCNITPEQTTFFDVEYSPNLLNLETLSVGKYIYTDGNLRNNTSYTTTDFIPCSAGDVIRHQFTYNNKRYDNTTGPGSIVISRVASYDENKTYITNSLVIDVSSYTVPTDVSYVRISYWSWNKGNCSDSAVIISDSAEVIPFYPYGECIKKEIDKEYIPEDVQFSNKDVLDGISQTDITNWNNKSDFSGSYNDLTDKPSLPTISDITPEQTTFFNIEYSPNLLNLETLLHDTRINDSGEVYISTGSAQDTTDFIPCSSGDVIRYQFNYGVNRWDNTQKSGYTSFKIAAYDENKTFISGSILSGARVYTVPDGASFVRVECGSWNKGSFTDCAIIISDSAAVIPFYEYGIIMSEKIDEQYIPNESVNAFLPNEICCAVGRTIEIYNNQVCLQAEKYHIKWDCTIGKAMKRKFSITGTTTNIGSYTLSLSVYNDSLDLLWSGSTTLKIVAASTNEVSVCCIGDSLTNTKAWEAELYNLNGNISLVGTLTGSHPDSSGTRRTFSHEGRSGWTAAKYLTAGDAVENPSQFKYINPFYNSSNSRFDWNYYVTNKLNGVSPSAVQIYLGTNGIALDPAQNVNAIKQIVDYIRQDNTTIPIYVVNTLYRSNQNGIGVQTGSDGYTAANAGKYKYEEDKKVFNLMVALTEALKNYTNLYFVPIALCHDSEYNFGAVETPVNPRAVQTELLPTEGTHPQNQGYYQMADIMFSVISAH